MAWHIVNKIQGDLGTYNLVRFVDQASNEISIGTMIDEIFWHRTDEELNKEADYEIIRDKSFPAALKYSSKVLKFPHIIIRGDKMCFVMPGQDVKTSDKLLKLKTIPFIEEGIYVCYTKDFAYDPNTHLGYALDANKFYQRYLIAEVMNLNAQFNNMTQSLCHPVVLSSIQDHIKVATEDMNREYAYAAKVSVYNFNKRLGRLLRSSGALYDLIYDIVKDV